MAPLSKGRNAGLNGDGPDQTESSAPSLVGRLLCGKWRVERRLGAGGMSVVYVARHRNGRRVAIKVLAPELSANTRMRARFLREGYIANRVGHDGAVAVLDDDTEASLVFLVMELLEGETLNARCRRAGGKLAANEVLFVADGLLEVLISAHERGIVHRDVKPSNVFLRRDGQVKLLDFGIASMKELSITANHTHSGSTLGTPGFMAPEQARGRSSDVDARTDIWGVGASLFRLLSGRLVHEAENGNEALVLAATEPAPALASLGLALPPSVNAVVDRALSFDRRERWSSAREMRDAVRRARAELDPYVWEPLLPSATEATTAADDSGTGSRSRSAGGEHSGASWAEASSEFPIRRPKQRPLRARWLAFGVLVLGLGAAVAVGLRGRSLREPAPALDAPEASERHAHAHAARSPDTPAPKAPASAELSELRSAAEPARVGPEQSHPALPTQVRPGTSLRTALPPTHVPASLPAVHRAPPSPSAVLPASRVSGTNRAATGTSADAAPPLDLLEIRR